MNDLSVRVARPDDAPALAPLLAEVGFPVPADTISRRMDSLEGPAELMLVAEIRNAIVGFLTVHFASVVHRPAPVARLTLLSVSEQSRGLGVGRALVQAAERGAADRGCEIIEVISNRRFAGAHGFYERIGYELTSYKFKKVLAP